MTDPQAATRPGLRFGGGDVLALTLLLAPPVAIYASAGIALLAIMAALAIIALNALNRRWPDIGAKTVLAALILVAVWGAVSALWSIRPDESLKRALQLAGIFLAGGILLGAAQDLDDGQRKRVAMAAVAGIALALALVFFERLTGGALRRLFEPGVEAPLSAMNRASTLLVLLSSAPAAYLWRDGRHAGVIALVVGVGAAAFALESASARVAWGVAVTAAILAWFLPRLTVALLAIGVAASILLAPVAVSLLPNPDPRNVERRAHLPPSAAHRALIWHYAAGKIDERPLWGWGLDASRSLPDARAMIPWDMGPQPPGAPRYATIVLMPLHPHNAPLQWRLELGLPGALLGTGVALLALASVERAAIGRAERAGALALLAAGLTVAVISYGAWQSWWLLGLFLAAAGMAAVSRRASSGKPA